MKRCGFGENDFAEKSLPPTKRVVHWSKGLLSSMQDRSLIMTSDDKAVIIKDLYPKAKHHYLILPKEDISSMNALNGSHIKLIRHMLKLAKVFTAQFTKVNCKFQYGFHSKPSMTRLHMHIISQDFDSLHLKTKKHWNSFTTDFFMDAEVVISKLQDEGQVVVDPMKCDSMLKQPLHCHVCHEPFPTMPKLKLHIKLHVSD